MYFHLEIINIMKASDHGSIHTWSQGSAVLWYYGNMLLWYYGNMLLWYYGNMLLWYYGNMYTKKLPRIIPATIIQVTITPFFVVLRFVLFTSLLYPSSNSALSIV
jgi:hypothetical protein